MREEDAADLAEPFGGGVLGAVAEGGGHGLLPDSNGKTVPVPKLGKASFSHSLPDWELVKTS
jgi:hypothetical protein